MSARSARKWDEPEYVTGIVKNVELKMSGAAALRVQMTALGKHAGPTMMLMYKVCENGSCEFMGVIQGTRCLDHPDRGGLGFTPMAGSRYLHS